MSALQGVVQCLLANFLYKGSLTDILLTKNKLAILQVSRLRFVTMLYIALALFLKFALTKNARVYV